MKPIKRLFKKVFIFILPFNLFAQVSFIPVSADYAVFQMNDSLAYVEFYLSFFQNNLQYEHNEEGLQASFENRLIISYNGKEYKNIVHNFQNTVEDSIPVNKYGQFLDIFTVPLPFKNFTTTLRVTDKLSGYMGEYLLNLNIPGHLKTFNLSDIQFASLIKSTDKKGKFIKNHLDITAYPRRTYDLLQPMLYFYIELHNLSFNAQNPNQYTFNYFVTNENGDTLKNSPVTTKKIAGTAQVEIGAFNALSLPEGVYYLNIHAQDLFSGLNSNSRKRFYVHKPSQKKKPQNKVSDIDPVFNTLDKKELQREFDAARYFATNREEDIFEKLEEVQAIRTFLTTFWREQDAKNGTYPGLSRERFLKLVRMADKEYGSSMSVGYKSDRGRILLIYGEPDEIIRYPNTTDTIPYEDWRYYSLNGGSNFIFADRNGFGKYELLHSNYYKELQDPDWYRLVLKARTSQGDDGQENR
jgi:GWxTD domain-containing protein